MLCTGYRRLAGRGQFVETSNGADTAAYPGGDRGGLKFTDGGDQTSQMTFRDVVPRFVGPQQNIIMLYFLFRS